MEVHVREAIEQALGRLTDLTFPSGDIIGYIMETDWSNKFSGFILYAIHEKSSNDSMCLVDLGNHVHDVPSSSYLGELGAIV